MNRNRRPVRLSLERVEDRIALTTFPGNLLASLSDPQTSRMVDDNDSTATAIDLGELTESFRVRGHVGSNDVRDVYRFALPSENEVTLDLEGLAADADLYLLDGNRRIVAHSDRAGATGEQVESRLTGGEYFVVVTRYRVWDSTNYTLTIDPGQVTPPDLAGNTLLTAVNIGSIEGTRTFGGSVGVAHDTADFIRFAVDDDAEVRLELSELSADIDLYLYSDEPQRLASSVRPRSLNEHIDVSLDTGTYYLGIVPYRDANSDYRLRITQTNIPGPQRPPGPVSFPVANPPRETETTPPVTDSEPLPDVPYFGSGIDWAINDVRAPEAWAAGYSGQDVTVAVVDTGVDLTHPDLVDSIWENSDEILGDGIDNDRNGFVDDRFGWDFVSQDNNPSDGNGHGTHVAGIVAAANDGAGVTGVAFDAGVMPIRVLGEDGSGSASGVARGIRYAVDNGADVINLSLGGVWDTGIRSALAYARAHDVLIVAASGNSASSVPSYPAAFSANLSNVLSVGAFDNRGASARFSNHVGPSGSVQVDAPGVGIYSTIPAGRYRPLSGTSMAAPHVAGVAALTISANPQITSAELREALVAGASASISGSDSVGAVNAARSIPLAIS